MQIKIKIIKKKNFKQFNFLSLHYSFLQIKTDRILEFLC